MTNILRAHLLPVLGKYILEQLFYYQINCQIQVKERLNLFFRIIHKPYFNVYIFNGLSALINIVPLMAIMVYLNIAFWHLIVLFLIIYIPIKIFSNDLESSLVSTLFFEIAIIYLSLTIVKLSYFSNHGHPYNFFFFANNIINVKSNILGYVKFSVEHFSSLSFYVFFFSMMK